MLLGSLFRAIPNPLTVGPAANGIIIDPANSRIQYTGTARPTELIMLPYYGVLSGTSGSAFDGGGSEVNSYIDGVVGADAANNRGVRTHAIIIPWWVDVSDTIELVTKWQPTTIGTNSAGVCAFGTRYDRSRDGDTTPISEGSSTIVASSAVQTSYRQRTDIFGSYAGGTFAVGDMVAFNYFRDGTHATDTFDTSGGGSGAIRISLTGFLRVRRRYS